MQNKLAAVIQLDAVKHNHRVKRYGQANAFCCRPSAKGQQKGLVFGISEEILQNSTENPILRSWCGNISLPLFRLNVYGDYILPAGGGGSHPKIWSNAVKTSLVDRKKQRAICFRWDKNIFSFCFWPNTSAFVWPPYRHLPWLVLTNYCIIFVNSTSNKGLSCLGMNVHSIFLSQKRWLLWVQRKHNEN